MKVLKHRAAVLMTALSLGVFAFLGVTISPAGGALRSAESGALRILSASRPIIDVSAQGNCVPVASGTCISPFVALGSKYTLVDRIAVTGQVTAVCGPFSFTFFSSVNLQLDQAAGHEVAHAFASRTPTCDGSAHTYTLTAVAFNVPFHRGSAVATGSVQAQGNDIFFGFDMESASTTQAVTLS